MSPAFPMEIWFKWREAAGIGITEKLTARSSRGSQGSEDVNRASRQRQGLHPHALGQQKKGGGRERTMADDDSPKFQFAVQFCFFFYLNSHGAQSRLPIEYQQTASNRQNRDPNPGFLTPRDFAHQPWVTWLKFNFARNPTRRFDEFGPGKVLWGSLVSCISDSFTWDCLLGEGA